MNIKNEDTKKAINFYFFMLIAYFFDNIILISLIWVTLHKFNSTLILGGIMSIAGIIPFVLSKTLKVKSTLKNLAIIKGLSYFVLIMLLFTQINLIVTFFYLGIIFGIGNYFNLSTFQIKNVQLIESRVLSSNIAARCFQGSMQIGTFLGVALGAYLLNILEFEKYLIYTSVMIICYSIALYLSYKNDILQVETNKKIEKEKIVRKFLDMKYIFLMASFGLLGAHISSFNIVAPVIFQKIHNWNSIQFGIIDALAGFGAFIAIFVPKKYSQLIIYVSILLISSDIVFGVEKIYYLVAISTGLIGFSIGYISIFLREKISKISIETNSTDEVSNTSSFIYNIFYGISPLLVSTIIDQNILLAKYILGVIAIFLLVNLFKVRK